MPFIHKKVKVKVCLSKIGIFLYVVQTAFSLTTLHPQSRINEGARGGTTGTGSCFITCDKSCFY